MTCIVGLETPHGVIIGGDSAGTGGYAQVIRSDEKVWREEKLGFVFGFTSSFRFGQLLRYSLTMPVSHHDLDTSDDDAVYKWMVTDFIDAVRKTMKSGGYLQTESGVESIGVFLVGAWGRLFYVGADLQVGRAAQGFDAVGSGAQAALGALWALTDIGTEEPGPIVLKALAAAATLNAAVAGPFTVITEQVED